MEWQCSNGHRFLEQGSPEEVTKRIQQFGCSICSQENQKQHSQNEELATLIAEKVAAALKPFLTTH